MSLLTQSQIVELLRAAVEAAGTQKAFAQQHDVSEQYITDVLRGRREPGAKILAALGYEKVVSYRQIDGMHEPAPEVGTRGE